MAGNYTESNETSALNNANTTETVVTNVPDDDGYATYDYDYYNVAVVGIFLHVLAIMFCLVSFIFVIYYRTNPIIAKAQPRFLVVIIFGALLMATAGCSIVTAVFKWDAEPDPSISDGALFYDIMCMLWVWQFLFGHICVYMGLYGKLRRIYKVAHLTSRRSKPIPIWYGMWPILVLRILSFALLLAWSIVEIPKWVILEYDDGSKSFGTCDYTATGQLKFLISLVLLIFVSAVLGAQMAYRARKLPQELTDVNQIFQIYCCHLVIVIIFGSLFIIARVLTLPTALITANVLMAICESITSIGPLMVPKMYYIWYERKHGHLPEGVHTIGRGGVHVNTGSALPPPPTTTTTSTTTRE